MLKHESVRYNRLLSSLYWEVACAVAPAFNASGDTFEGR